MSDLKVQPDGRQGPYPQDAQTQTLVSELDRVEAAILAEREEAVKRLCSVYWVKQLRITPLLLKNANEPYSLKHYVLYKDELWSSMRCFLDCEWAVVVKRQMDVDYDLPIDISSFLALGNDGFNCDKNTIRKPISEDVRFVVWRRDQGRCAKCGSREKLEFDHIIPLSRGGSSTARKIELLCESCNRKKGATV